MVIGGTLFRSKHIIFSLMGRVKILKSPGRIRISRDFPQNVKSIIHLSDGINYSIPKTKEEKHFVAMPNSEVQTCGHVQVLDFVI